MGGNVAEPASVKVGRWLLFGTPAVAALALVISAIAFAGVIDMGVVTVCLWGAWGFATVGTWLEPDVRALPFRRRALATVAIAVVAGLALLWLHGYLSNYMKEHSAPPPSPPTPSFIQLQQMHEIDELLVQQNDYGLQAEFDLLNMLNLNIAIQKKALAPKLLTAEEILWIDSSKNFPLAIQKSRTRFFTLNGGGLQAEALPGQINRIYLTPRYDQAKDLVDHYANSAALPRDIRVALTNFSKLLDYDTNSITDALNEARRQSPDNIIYDHDGHSPIMGRTSAIYWGKYRQLQPEAQRIGTLIGKYLDPETK